MATFVSNLIDTIGANTGITDIARGAINGDVNQATRGLETLRGGPRPYLPDDPIRDTWMAANSSYSGTDVVPIVQLNGTLVTLANVETISISVFREKEPVRTLGRSYVKCYTAGQRTIAGSITFIVFNRDPFWDIIKNLKQETQIATDRFSTPVGDQIPPFNLILWFSNEYGHKSVMTLLGVEFTQEGQVHSVNDIYSEKTVQYVARDYNVLMDQDDVGAFRNLMYERQLTGQFTDNYLASMMDHLRTVQSQIQDTQNLISQMKQEKYKGVIASFGIGFLFGKDIDTKIKTQELKLSKLQIEEIDTQIAIDQWSKSAYASGGLNSNSATQYDNMRTKAPATNYTTSSAQQSLFKTLSIPQPYTPEPILAPDPQVKTMPAVVPPHQASRGIGWAPNSRNVSDFADTLK